MAVPYPPGRRFSLAGRIARAVELPLASATVLLLLLLPSSVVLAGPLRSNGSPVRLLGFLGLALVLGSVFARREGPRGVGAALLASLGALAVFSYGIAQARPLTEIERDGSLRALLFTLSAVGAALYLLWAARNRRALDVLVGLMVAGAATSAVLGVLQFYTPLDVAGLLRPPGFVLNVERQVGDRSLFVRVLGTAAHPIEFGVLLGALTPLAWHLASWARTRMARRAAAGASVLMLVAIPMAVSRSGLVTVAVAGAVYSLTWTWRQRANAAVLALVGVLAFRSVIPGLLGTLRSLFLRADEDPSISGRTDDYQLVNELVAQDPWVGRGLGTFRPGQYIYLDNQWLLSLLEGGVVGLVGLAALFFGGAALARGAYHRATDPGTRSLAQALTAALLALAVSGLTFDLLSFQQVALLTFLLVGMAGALHRQLSTPSLRSAQRRAAAAVPT